MIRAIGVDGRPGVQPSASVVVAESTSGFLDQDRWRGVVPDLATEPDADVDLAFGHRALVAPRPVNWFATAQSPNRLLMMAGESGEGRKDDDSI